MTTLCAYPSCEEEAEFTCTICQDQFCAFHTYESGGYVCKNDFDDYEYIDPHAPKNSAEMIGGFIREDSGKPYSLTELFRKIASFITRNPYHPDE